MLMIEYELNEMQCHRNCVRRRAPSRSSGSTMKLPRRQFIKLATSAAVLPALSLGSALAQPPPNPERVPEPTPSERAAMARIAHAFIQKYDVPALSFAVRYAGDIGPRDAFSSAVR